MNVKSSHCETSHKDVDKIVGTGGLTSVRSRHGSDSHLGCHSLPWTPLRYLDGPQCTNLGRDIDFSADLRYNGVDGKPRPLGEVAAKPTERVR